MTDFSSKKGKLIVDGDHYTYWNPQALVYVRDGENYTHSTNGPHFMDLGVMGSCRQNCYKCYMRSRRVNANMSYDKMDEILYKYRNTLCQVAFGGAGDPIDHEEFYRFRYAGAGRSHEAWGRANPKLSRMNNVLDSEYAASWKPWNAPVDMIARCVTINPAGRAYTPDQLQGLAAFTAVGLSCGEVTGYGADRRFEDAKRLLQQAEQLDYGKRPKFVLHLIVGDMHNDLRKFIHLLSYDCVEGVLLLAEKADPKAKRGWEHGAFYTRKFQTAFWESVAAVKNALPNMSIAVDSCLAPLVDPELFPGFEDGAMSPCDAGRFSMYVHADGTNWLCSCSDKSVRSWRDATRRKQFCGNVLFDPSKQAGDLPPSRVEWPNPEVVIHHGPMTNSSSSSYFVIAPKKASLKLEVLDFLGREKLSDEDGFSWYTNNKRLVRVTPHEWAGWCATEISGSDDPVYRKKTLDTYTKRLVEGDDVFYLVADRDDGDGPGPKHYEQEDVSKDKRVVLIAGDGEH